MVPSEEVVKVLIDKAADVASGRLAVGHNEFGVDIGTDNGIEQVALHFYIVTEKDAAAVDALFDRIYPRTEDE